MRGEHGCLDAGAYEREGSSPHARGAPLEQVMHALLSGIIPACAGSTAANWSRTRCGRDHPRMRGEHDFKRGFIKFDLGSSPHARGAPCPASQRSGSSGIIPACAGSTVYALNIKIAGEDHPRMRGEHSTPIERQFASQGSSPHARGAPWALVIAGVLMGIIPACAGSTGRICSSLESAWDHPRMRGEHVGGGQEERRAHGIIPACAGSTLPPAQTSCSSRDHPRMRGEHVRLRPGLTCREGSSPHARGAHLNTCGFAQDSSESH